MRTATTTSTPLSSTPRSSLNRAKDRARTDRAELYAVLDEALICHLGVLRDGTPMVLPTCYGRLDDTLYLHGSTGASSLRAGARNPVCVTVTLVDGLVYARSVFHHSANYRCAVVYGAVLRLDLTEASVKVRSGPPVDDEADVAAGSAWAGVLPTRTTFGVPEPCELLPDTLDVPPHVLALITPASAPG